MVRINLYNYRLQQVYYLKIRSIILILIGIFLALVINGFIYTYYKIKIMNQETRNSFLTTTLDRLEDKLVIVHQFNQQAQLINSKIELVKKVDEKRDDMVALLQQLSKLTPDGLNFTILSINGSRIEFNGMATSPLYVADFLQNLRDANQVFKAPTLRANTTADGTIYNFAITAELESNLIAESQTDEKPTVDGL